MKAMRKLSIFLPLLLVAITTSAQYTTGSGYRAARQLPPQQQQWQQPPQQQQYYEPPYSYGDVSGLPYSDCGNLVRQKKARLEDWVHAMKMQGYDVVRPRTDIDMKHHTLFNALVSELDYLRQQCQ